MGSRGARCRRVNASKSRWNTYGASSWPNLAAWAAVQAKSREAHSCRSGASVASRVWPCPRARMASARASSSRRSPRHRRSAWAAAAPRASSRCSASAWGSPPWGVRNTTAGGAAAPRPALGRNRHASPGRGRPAASKASARGFQAFLLPGNSTRLLGPLPGLNFLRAPRGLSGRGSNLGRRRRGRRSGREAPGDSGPPAPTRRERPESRRVSIRLYSNRRHRSDGMHTPRGASRPASPRKQRAPAWRGAT